MTSTAGEVHHVYTYMTCPETGTLLSRLNIAIIFSVLSMCVCVCCVCVLCVLCVCVGVSSVCANVYVTS